jgi:hypothetical protein
VKDPKDMTILEKIEGKQAQIEQYLGLPSVLAVDMTKLEESKSKGAMVLQALTQQTAGVTFPLLPEHAQAFADYHARAHIIVQDSEAERETLVRPLLDDKQRIDKMYKESRTPWEGVKALCARMIAGDQNHRIAAEAEARRLASEAASRDDVVATTAALAAIPEASKPAGVTVGSEWHAFILDTRLLPRDWLVIDEAKVKAHCKAHAKSEIIPDVPGLRFERRAKVGAGR